tara:strand:+ start:85 stop:345 length:261 start_codon:yes stop_codon:yes gene_type:complete
MMPYYDYVCESCGLEFEESLPIVDRNIPIEQPCRVATCEGKVKMLFAKPYIGDPWSFTGKKIDDGFKDRLKEIKKMHPHNTINIPR